LVPNPRLRCHTSVVMAVPLYQLVSHHQRDPVGFKASLTAPALVWEGPPVRAPEHGDEPFNSQPTLAGASDGAPQSGEVRVFFVRKESTRSNAFSMGVTIGRLASNDVVLDAAAVSRFHAFLQQDAKSGQWTLSDAGSDNGTFVDGRRLEPRKGQVLADGVRVTFGGATLTFLLPGSLARYVERQALGP
jgi:pSer/pThr/pTyr-binding forkhead associated (FHA) protein